jgi:hypothetical protein
MAELMIRKDFIPLVFQEIKPIMLLLILLSGLSAGFIPCSARADIKAESYLSFWWTIYEEMENEALQLGTEDEAAEVASGFSLNKARLSFYYLIPEHHIQSKVKLRMEGSFAVYDAYISYQPSDLFKLYMGQMKVPSTYEVLTSEHLLDFITRTTLSSNIVNYSLSKTPYDSDLHDINCGNRDLGFGIKGSWNAGQDHDVFRYFLMVANGMGVGMYIGGEEKKRFIISNEFGDYFYGIRLDLSPWEWMTLGGHYDYNIHHDILLNDEETVYDLDRTSYSADLRLLLPFNFRLTGLYGEGVVDDDWFQDGKKDYEFSGWEARLFKGFLENKLEMGVRYDTYSFEYNESGDITHENHWTYGINYQPLEGLRLQMNYITKDTESEYQDDLDDNIIFLNVQLFFQAGLGQE